MIFLEKLSFYFAILTIILAPFYVFRGELNLSYFNLFIPTTFLEILILISIFFTSLVILIKKDFRYLRTKFDILISLFLLSAFISLFKSYDFLGGIGIFKAYFLEPILFYYLLIYQSRRFGYKFIIYSLITSGALLIILAVIQKLTGTFALAPNELKQDRIPGPYNSANSLALYLAPISLITFIEFIKYKGFRKIFLLVIFFGMIVVLFWTRSRGGFLSLLLAFLIFAYSSISKKIEKLKKIWLIVPITVLLLLTLFLYQLYLNYNSIPLDKEKIQSQSDTLQIRYFIWAGTINLLKDHPIFGAGLNGFRYLYSNDYKILQFQEIVQYPHNLILTFWSEMGLLGLISFLLLIVSAFSLLIRNLSKKKNYFLGAGLISILSYWMIHGVVDVPYFKNDLSLEFFVILALIYGWYELEEGKTLKENT